MLKAVHSDWTLWVHYSHKAAKISKVSSDVSQGNSKTTTMGQTLTQQLCCQQNANGAAAAGFHSEAENQTFLLA